MEKLEIIRYRIRHHEQYGQCEKECYIYTFHVYHLFFNYNKIIEELHIRSHPDSISKKHLHTVEATHRL